jgi:nucleoside-diphosphate-sugar epimerase
VRVLVTGASGHVGSAIAARLIETGTQLVSLSRRALATASPFEHATFDIGVSGVADAIAATVPRCDAIVHAAASLDRDPHSPSIAVTNCLGTQEMLRLASLWQSTNFIFISSVPVIGVPRDLPITEHHPTGPPTAYHASKLYGEHLVRLATRDNFATFSLRITSPVGPGMPANRILSAFVRQAMANQPIRLAGRGTRRQDYVDVRDIAIAVEQCLASPGGVSGLYNIASGQAVSNEELARRCVAALRSQSPIEFDGRLDSEEGVVWDVSIERARQRLGYQPQFDLESSIQAVATEAAAAAEVADHANRHRQ